MILKYEKSIEPNYLKLTKGGLHIGRGGYVYYGTSPYITWGKSQEDLNAKLNRFGIQIDFGSFPDEVKVKLFLNLL